MGNENKKYMKHILFGISLLPYAILIYMCICYAFGGYRYPGGEEIVYGFHAIGILLSNIFFTWAMSFIMFPYSLPIILIIGLWIGYQIYYIITFENTKNKNEKTSKKINIKKILFYIAIVCWCLYFIHGIFIFFVYVMNGKRSNRDISIYIKMVFICIFNYPNITNFLTIYCYLFDSK